MTKIVLLVLLLFVSCSLADECGYTKSAICETASAIMDACLKTTQGNVSLCQDIVSQVNGQTEEIVKNVYDAHWDYTGYGGWHCNVRLFNWPTACEDNAATELIPLYIITLMTGTAVLC